MATHEPDPSDDTFEEVRAVRPYTLTGGRTQARAYLPLEALVRAVMSDAARTAAAVTPERRRIHELTTDSILSVAELSAHLRLPLGVIRVLVGDLADAGSVVVHGGATSAASPATDLKVLESVRHGISAL